MTGAKLSRGKNNGRRNVFCRENVDITNVMNSVNEKLNSIVERLHEAETFMSATKEYVKMSRKMIANLRNCTAFLEVEVRTAEEALLESERTISSLKFEMETDFSSFHKSQESHEGIYHRTKGIKKRHTGKNKFNRYNPGESLTRVNGEISFSTTSDENERKSENEDVPHLKSNPNSEVSDQDSVQSWLKHLKKLHSDSDFVDDCGKNLIEDDYTSLYRGNKMRKSFSKHSFETDSKTSRNKSSSDSFSNKADYDSGSESDHFYNRKKYYSKLLQKNLKQKYNRICASEVDALSLKKIHRSYNTHNTGYNNDLNFVNSEVSDSSTNDEYYSENGLYSNPYQAESISKENDKNTKAKLGLPNSLKPSQDKEKEILSNQYSEPEANRLKQGYICSSQEETGSQYYKNGLTAISLRDIILQTENSEGIFKQCDKYCCTSESEDKSVISNNSYLNSTQISWEGCQHSSEDADSAESAFCSNWTGETLIILNSTQPYVIENSVESPSNVSSAIRKEESCYISVDSSFCSNESTYFSFVRDDHIGENSFIPYSSSNNLEPPSEDTTDTSVYDFSSDNKQSDSLHSRSSSEVLENTEILDMSLTDISENSKIPENSNSFQFHSDSSLEDNSCLETYSSNFSMSKNSPSFLQTHPSYESFREGVLSASLNASSNEETSSESPSEESSSRGINSSHALENGLSAIDTCMAAKNDLKYYPYYHSYDGLPILGSVISESSKISDMSKQDSLQTNLKKSKSWEMCPMRIICSPHRLPKNLPLVKSENSKRYETENKMYSFRKVDIFEKMKPVNAKIYSKSIRSFLQDNHWIQ